MARTYHPFTGRKPYAEAETRELEWRVKKETVVFLLLASLSLSTAIALLIVRQLQRSPFF